MHEDICLQPSDKSLVMPDIIHSKGLCLVPCLFDVGIGGVHNKGTLTAGTDGQKHHMTGRRQTVRRLMFFK